MVKNYPMECAYLSEVKIITQSRFNHNFFIVRSLNLLEQLDIGLKYMFLYIFLYRSTIQKQMSY